MKASCTQRATALFRRADPIAHTGAAAYSSSGLDGDSEGLSAPFGTGGVGTDGGLLPSSENGPGKRSARMIILGE